MPPVVIANTYEIHKAIGSGGSGIVYLAYHRRLNKFVVLKADRRSGTSKLETLRQEVDALKNLSHTYIPQVYDFIVEDKVVYTVMDFIEGESLDKPLKRGEHFSQTQVIPWACQLLEALVYLHSYPPYGILHSDIKPANVMLTPQGTIRLIDFNISLALGEQGAVRLGLSHGYASPEHYGFDFRRSDTGGSFTGGRSSRYSTRGPVAVGQSAVSGSFSSHSVVVDVRSDIYSVGATLYHLLSGVRPNADARQVVPLSGNGISPSVSAIIQKAMEPDPDMRYQSAAEMLDDFVHLRDYDPRTRSFKRRTAVVAGVLIAAFLAGGFVTLTGMARMERTQNALALAGTSTEALRRGDVPLAISDALEALPKKQGLFDPAYTPQAQKALADALGVYDLNSAYHQHTMIDLDSEPVMIGLSPSGDKTAVLTLDENARGHLSVFETESGNEIVKDLPTQPTALAEFAFADENTLIYAGETGITAYDLLGKKQLWTGKPATKIAVSEDGTTAAGVYMNETSASVYSIQTGTKVKDIGFYGKKLGVMEDNTAVQQSHNLFSLNSDGTKLAVSFSDGTVFAFNLVDTSLLDIYLDKSGYTHFEGGFSGNLFGFAAANSKESFFWVTDLVLKNRMTHTTEDGFFYHMKVVNHEIFLVADRDLARIDVSNGKIPVLVHQDSKINAWDLDENGIILTDEAGAVSIFDSNGNLFEKLPAEESSDFVQTGGAYVALANRGTPGVRILKREDHADANVFQYDGTIKHDEARFSEDGNTVMLFSVSGFHLFDRAGTPLKSVEFEDPEQIYNLFFLTEAGKSYLEVLYKDGVVERYSAEDGSLLSRNQGAIPDDSRVEYFETDRYSIKKPLQGAAEVFDKKTGKKLKDLQVDEARITYIAEAGDYIVIQCQKPTVAADRSNMYFGLLCNQELEELAHLPGVCDVRPDGTLIFDDMRGTLRQSEIYSLDELRSMAESKIGSVE